MKKKIFIDPTYWKFFNFPISKLKMKLFITLFLFSILQTIANHGYSQQKLSIDYENVPLKKIINKIQDQTDFKFLYRSSEINLEKGTTLKVKKKSLDYILKEIFSGTDIEFTILDKQIILTKRKKSKPERKILFQEKEIKGNVKDEDGNPLPGANVLLKGTSIGALTDFDGNFTLIVSDSNSTTLVVSYIGFATKEVNIVDKDFVSVVLLTSSEQLEDIVVTGSRSKPRSLLDTAVAIDVIGAKVIENAPQSELGQIMQFAAPSFHSTNQNIGHGTDHIDPIALRGLGADQTLVLINGKRRHATSLMNVNGTVGRGQVGTDLNAIPTAAIERIEVLRDGAAAQYGSDAIAGVINIILKKSTDEGSIDIATGTTYEGDGETFNFNANYGFGVGEEGFVNFTTVYNTRQLVNRSGDYTGAIFGDERDNDPVAINAFFNQSNQEAINAYNQIYGANFGNAFVNPANDFRGNRVMNVGASAISNASLAVNSEIPFNNTTKFYANGMFNFRLGEATGFYRFPRQEARQSGIHPLGFSPKILSDIVDVSATAGISSVVKGWNFDVSNNYGTNSFSFTIENSNNASQGLASETVFEAGSLKYQQNVINVDLSKSFGEKVPVNVGFGGEFRLENYQQIAGQRESFAFFGDTTSTGTPREAGSQVFPGYRDTNETNQNRFNTALYVDLEADFTKKWLVGLAGRIEDYSDFGDKFTWKVSSRYKITDNITFRGAFNTGFRAPSLPQKFFSSFTLQFITVNGEQQGVDIAHLNDDSNITRQFGIPNLKPETSISFSFGLTARLFERLSVTLDAYDIRIKDRIGITGRFASTADPRFAAILDPAGLSRAQFMTNAIDTETKGLDFVVSYRIPLGENSLTLSGTGNFTETNVTEDDQGNEIINTGSFLQGFESTLFNREEISRIEVAQPRSKIILGALFSGEKLSAGVNVTRFGEITYIAPNPNPVLNTLTGTEEVLDQVFTPKWLTDVNISYDVIKDLKLTVSLANLFNVFPDEHTHSANRSNDLFPFSRRVSQFGLLGGNYSVGLKYSF